MAYSELFNLIPIGLLVWAVLIAVKKGRTVDGADRYFQKYKEETGQKFHNWFGVPKP